MTRWWGADRTLLNANGVKLDVNSKKYSPRINTDKHNVGRRACSRFDVPKNQQMTRQPQVATAPPATILIIDSQGFLGYHECSLWSWFIPWICGGFVMVTKRIVFILVLLAFATPASRAWALLTIYDYHSENHYRFNTSIYKAFIGEGYDFSGVSRASDGKWVTMISPRYFLTAKHYQPASGKTATFYEGNTLDSESHTYTVDSWFRIIDGDLSLCRLTENISENIKYYPILEFADDENYMNLTFYVYGQQHRVGRNQIDEISRERVRHDGVYVYTDAMSYDYDDPPDDPPDGVGGDECRLADYDSGGPSLAIYNGELALVGIHWFQDGTAGSGDSFVPHYIDEIASILSSVGENLETVTPLGGDANMDGIVNDIDATILAANWGQSDATWAQGDFTGDKLVNDLDAAIMSANWLQPSETVSYSAVPEPTAAVLLFIGSLFAASLYFRRRG